MTLGSVNNFDRDLQFAFSSAQLVPEIGGPGNQPIATVGNVMTSFQVIQRYGEGDFGPIPASQGAAAGVIVQPPATESLRRVYRVKGAMIAEEEDVFCLVMMGYTDTVDTVITISQKCLLAAGRGVLNIDVTTCIEGSYIQEPGTNYNPVIFARFFTAGADHATGFLNYALSVQDLGIAPPEYEAARR